MIDREHDLPITRQAEVLRISRGSVYYLPRPVPEADLAIMRRLDRLHLELPFAGARMLRGMLAAEGCKIGRRHVKTLMRRMGIEALYRRPRTTKPEPGHKVYPYLLRGVEITRPNQVWAMDITYIPMTRGFVYLAVVLDWASRRVLSWRLSITMEAAFCVEALEDAMAHHGKPEILNTDQGSQFTGSAFTGVLANNGIAISMDGKGAWRDNVFVERLWRSVKYEVVYLRAMRPRRAPPSGATSTSTIAAGRIRALTTPHPITPTSPRCPSVRRPNPGRRSTYRRGKTVQTTGATQTAAILNAWKSESVSGAGVLARAVHDLPSPQGTTAVKAAKGTDT
jgi:putative transposase